MDSVKDLDVMIMYITFQVIFPLDIAVYAVKTCFCEIFVVTNVRKMMATQKDQKVTLLH